MKYRSFRIGKRGYTIFNMTPITIKRVITTLRTLHITEETEIPEGLNRMTKAISYAVAGSGIFSCIKAYFLYRRILRYGKSEEIIQATKTVLEMLPTTEIYTLSTVFQQFNNLIGKQK